MSYVLGIDIGTTYTAAAVARGDSSEVVGLGAVTMAVPTVVFADEDPDSRLLVAEEATRRGTGDPDGLVRHFKRRLGDTVPLVVRDRALDAGDLYATVLRWVIDKVAEREGGSADHVVLTHPAMWGGYKRGLITRAADEAGLAEVTLLSEPEAAAGHYASQERVTTGALIAVYDLGGGTFDATLLRKTEDGFEFAASPLGVDELGGLDFDDALWARVAADLGPVLGDLDLSDPANRRSVAQLREDVIHLREALSNETASVLPVSLGDSHTEIRITRGEYEELIEHQVRRSIRVLGQLLGDAGLDSGDLHSVLLVGGASRTPLIGELVSRSLGRPVAIDVHPKFAVARGAALHATGASSAVPAGADLDRETEPAALEPAERDDETTNTGSAVSEERAPEIEPDPTEPDRWKRATLAGVIVVALGVIAVVVALSSGGGGDGGDAESADPTSTVGADEQTASEPAPDPSDSGANDAGQGMTGSDTASTIPADADSSASPQDPIVNLDYVPDLADGPVRWSMLFPPALGGPDDYMSLFESPGDGWLAKTSVGVFTLPSAWIWGFSPPEADLTDEQFATILGSLAENRLGLGVRLTAKTESYPCGIGTAVQINPATEENDTIQRIERLGGTIHFLVLDPPFYSRFLYDEGNSCGWSEDEIAEFTSRYVRSASLSARSVRFRFPEAVFGIIGRFGDDVDHLVSMLAAFDDEEEGLDFVLVEIDFDLPDWEATVKDMEIAARTAGVGFGVIWTGDEDLRSDAEWVAQVNERIHTYEIGAGGSPDHVMIQSTTGHPISAVSFGDFEGMGDILEGYDRTRTNLVLDPGSDPVSDTLLQASGSGVANAEIEIVSLSDPVDRAYSRFTIRGRVPEDATFADAGYRINTECDCVGEALIEIRAIEYRESDQPENLVPNSRFDQGADGLEGYQPWGSAGYEVLDVDGGSGKALLVSASPGEDAALNSPDFTVTSGAVFEATFVARVDARSIGSGYFNVNFQNPDAEVERFTLSLRPGDLVLETLRTDDDGRFASSIPGSFEAAVSFRGDSQYWPARVEVTG